MVIKVDNKHTGPNFGMAFYMPKHEKILSTLGYKAASAAKQAAPALEKCADDVDVFLKMENSKKTGLNAFKMFVRPLGEYMREEQSSILVNDADSTFTIDALSNYLVKTAQLLKSRFELPPKATSQEMIDPNFAPGYNVNAKFYLYVAQNRQGYMDDLKKDLKFVDDRFIEKKLMLGHIAEPLPDPTEIIEADSNYDDRRKYFITPAIINTINIYGIIKPEYRAQFEEEVRNYKF